MKVGDTVKRVSAVLNSNDVGQGHKYNIPLTGTVVYIHPKGRFHTVAFQTRGGTILESFFRI